MNDANVCQPGTCNLQSLAQFLADNQEPKIVVLIVDERQERLLHARLEPLTQLAAWLAMNSIHHLTDLEENP